MSDSFADLWNSSSLQKKPQTVSSLAQQQQKGQQGQRRPQGGQDLFALLSSSTSTTAPSSSSALSSTLAPQPPQPHQRKQQRKSTADAFSDLFSSSVSTIQSNLTIAQRTALADQQRKDKIRAHEKQQEKENLTWAGLDSLSASDSLTSKGPKSLSASVSKGLADDVDDWGLKDLGRPTATTSSQDKLNTRPANNLDTWNSDSLQEQPAKLSGGGSFWDLNEFTSSSSSTTNTRIQTPTHMDSHSFDLGNLADGSLNGQDRDREGQGDDDDFMSVFNKPPQSKQTSHQHLSSSPPSSAPLRMQNQSRAASPPPHVLGQVVEMGFSIPEAKAALAANDNDAQAAVEQLLASEGVYASGSGRSTPIRQADSTVPARALSPRSRGDRERELPQQQRHGETFSPSSSTSDIQAQAEQLLAQASVFSRGMFNKASIFLKEKKEQAQKAVEEYRTSTATSGGSNSGRAGTGKPKWMLQQPEEGNGMDVGIASPKDAFRDDVDNGKRDHEPEVWIPKRPDRQREKERQRAREREATATVATTSPPKEEPEIDLFAPDTSKTSFSSTPSRQQSSSSTERPRQESQEVTYKYQRNTSAVPSSIATLKSEANASFKLGQFGNAETLYTRAIDSLRSSSCGKDNLYFVLLLNNRANARMKTGDINGTIRDCIDVVGLITTNCLISDDDLNTSGTSSNQDKVTWDPSEDVNYAKFVVSITDSSPVQEEVVDLVDGLTKAIKRRAEAYEGLEKWNKAKDDWDLLRGCAWVRNESVRSEAGRGVGRCVRMTGGSGTNVTHGFSFSSASTTKQPRSSQPITSTTVVDKPSPALNALRTSTAAAEAEDRAKHELKDAVDARLSSWKNGKENNIRALLASLESVLWEELVRSEDRAVKVGMHELVMPAQVKMRYMKAVGRLHPDKLNPSNSTLEQRMIAQGVFGVLSEAWNAFKL